MKLIILIPILILSLISCKKDIPASVVEKQFTATVFLTPTEQTIGYEIFLSNDKNAPDSLRVFALRINKPKTNSFSFGFDFSGVVLCGILYADPHKNLYGATRELVAHGDRLEMNYNSIIIK